MINVKIEIMRAAGLEDNQIASLARLKKRVDNGQVDDLTIEHKRLTFFKFLHESGRLTESTSSHGETSISAQSQASIFRDANLTGK